MHWLPLELLMWEGKLNLSLTWGQKYVILEPLFLPSTINSIILKLPVRNEVNHIPWRFPVPVRGGLRGTYH